MQDISMDMITPLALERTTIDHVQPPKLSEVMEDYKCTIKLVLSPNTVRDYTLTLSRFDRYTGDRNVCDITARHVVRFLATVPGSRENKLNAWIGLSAFWTRMIRQGLAVVHVPRLVEPPRPEVRQIEPFERAEVELLLAGCLAGRCMQRDQAILLVLLDTGVRASELTAAHVGDWRGRSLKVYGKGAKERLVPMSARTEQVLAHYLGPRIGRHNERLFVTETAVPMTRGSLDLLMERLAARVHLANVYAHRFRHTFAIQYLMNGGDGYTL